MSAKRVRFTYDIKFGKQEEKEAFVKRLEDVRSLLSGRWGADLDNLGLMSAMFDLVEATFPARHSAGNERQTPRSFLRNNGKLFSPS